MKLTDPQAAVLRAVADAGGSLPIGQAPGYTRPSAGPWEDEAIDPLVDAALVLYDDEGSPGQCPLALTLAGRMALAVHEGLTPERRSEVMHLVSSSEAALRVLGRFHLHDSPALIDHLTADLRRALEVLADGVGESTP